MSLHRLSILAAVGLAVCALAGPALAQQDLRNPDTRDAAKASSQDLRNPDTRELPKYGGYVRGGYVPDTTVVRIPQPVQSADTGLDWGDAGIGAGGMLGLILLAAGGAAAVTHRKSASAGAATTG